MSTTQSTHFFNKKRATGSAGFATFHPDASSDSDVSFKLLTIHSYPVGGFVSFVPSLFKLMENYFISQDLLFLYETYVKDNRFKVSSFQRDVYYFYTGYRVPTLTVESGHEHANREIVRFLSDYLDFEHSGRHTTDSFHAPLFFFSPYQSFNRPVPMPTSL